jgi:hypothetical protein
MDCIFQGVELESTSIPTFSAVADSVKIEQNFGIPSLLMILTEQQFLGFLPA